jgi:hypothetical protein
VTRRHFATRTFVILPGVGSARSAMEHFNDSGAAAALRERFTATVAILGICLGMQLAMEHSDEDGGVEGLGLLGATSFVSTRLGYLDWGGPSSSRGARRFTSRTPSPCAHPKPSPPSRA